MVALPRKQAREASLDLEYDSKGPIHIVLSSSTPDATPFIQELLLRVLVIFEGASLTPIILDAPVSTILVVPSIALAYLPMTHVGPLSAPMDPHIVPIVPPQTS